MMTAAKDSDKYTDTSQGVLRNDIQDHVQRARMTNRGPEELEQSIRPLTPSRPPDGQRSALQGQPRVPTPISRTRERDEAARERRAKDWEREQRIRGVYEDIPTRRLVLPGPPPDTTPQPVDRAGDRTIYKIVERALPGGGHLYYWASLKPDGGGDLWWTDSNKTVCELKFPVPFEVIARLFTAALHAQGKWPDDPEPPDGPEKEGA